jgi:isopenicillin N synthase-like dioxygenase
MAHSPDVQHQHTTCAACPALLTPQLLKYPPTNGNTDAHTDYGCVTMLLPGDSGLQIHYQGAWEEVPFVPDAFVINFGGGAGD